ncbi:MAG: hypothetical protein U1E81_12500 [Xanthobacteraceae bacterium]
MSKETADAVALWANVGTFIALVLNAAALFVAARQLFDGRRASSAGALIALTESFRQAWLQFSNAIDEDAKQHGFADIMNLLECACAIFDDALFFGRTGRLLEDYLCHVFILIGQSQDARKRIEAMMLTEKTFEHILHFLQTHRDRVRGFSVPFV